MITPIFIVGTQRSGSNLLRLMLNESPDIAAPHPPHILKTFLPLLSGYGDLGKEDNFVRLVKDVCEFVQKNPVVWETVPAFEKVLKRIRKPSLIEIMTAVYEIPADAKGAQYWCCKSMANVEILPELYTALPNAKFIYLYRDGRDVALSFTKAFVGEKHFYAIAKQWRQDQQYAISFMENYPEAQVFRLRYEDFIQSPETELQSLCRFLEIDFTPAMLQYYQSKESQRAAESGEMWKNVVKPVLSENHHKFLKETSPEQIRIFETVAGDILKKLGYDLVNEESELIPFSDAQITAFNLENQRLKQLAREKTGREELSKRAGQEALIQAIKEYHYE